MKKFLLYLLALLPLSAFAQLTAGYYRVQNLETTRYMTIVDTRAEFHVGETYAGYVYADLDAIYMDNDFDGSVVSNPASICYIESISSDMLNLSGQDLNLFQMTSRYLNYLERPDHSFRLFATGSGGGMTVTRYLIDNTSHGTFFHPAVGDGTATSNNRNWKFLQVTQDNNQCFGVKPEQQVTADGSYWSTMYAGFPCKPSDATMKAYYVSKVDNTFGLAVISALPNNIIASEVPVLIQCTGATPKENKMTLLAPNTTGVPSNNQLVGNYYCNDQQNSTDEMERGHHNVTNYNASTMRMLGQTADGKLAFVKSNIKYLPANKAYLKVSSSAPDILRVVTEEEYQEILTGINEIASPVNNGQKVIYDLQGRRITAPSKGLYIVNGKKMVIK